MEEAPQIRRAHNLPVNYSRTPKTPKEMTGSGPDSARRRSVGRSGGGGGGGAGSVKRRRRPFTPKATPGNNAGRGRNGNSVRRSASRKSASRRRSGYGGADGIIDDEEIVPSGRSLGPPVNWDTPKVGGASGKKGAPPPINFDALDDPLTDRLLLLRDKLSKNRSSGWAP